MEQSEKMLLEALREISTSNQKLSDTLSKAINLADQQQSKCNSLLPVAITMLLELSQINEKNKRETIWFNNLIEALDVSIDEKKEPLNDH